MKKIVVLTGPSGVGKTSMADLLVEYHPERVGVCISHTTREPRGTEQNGVDYYFINQNKFDEMLENDEFVEYATPHGRSYGLTKEEIDRTLSPEGRKVTMFVADPDGAFQIKRIYKDDAILVFVLPTSWSTIEERLKERGTEDKESLKRRIDDSKEWIKLVEQFDNVVVNDELRQAVYDLMVVIESNSMKENHLPKSHTALIEKLLF